MSLRSSIALVCLKCAVNSSEKTMVERARDPPNPRFFPAQAYFDL